MLLNWTKNLLKKYAIKPNKRMGQNFLISAEARTKFIEAADIKKEDVVLEIGAGIGTITTELAALAKRVIAVEKDRALIPILKEVTKDFENIKIVVGDVLKIKDLKIYSNFKIQNSKLVGNIPYYLTAPLIRKFLESDNPPQAMTLMVQKEMAQRICANPPDMSILAISIQVYATPQIISYVSRSAFWPTPDVDSAILKITPFSSGQLLPTRCQLFFRVVKAGFASPRKQLINNLSAGLKISREASEQWLRSCDIDPKRRAETLTVQEWLRLTELSPPSLHLELS